MRSWFKWYAGSSTDIKFPEIAASCGVPLAFILAVWMYLLERAHENSGSVDGLACTALDQHLGMPKGTTECILNQMIECGLITDDMRVKNWKKLQNGTCTSERVLDVPQGEWAKLRQAVLERDSYTCRYCGKVGGLLECDHILPVSRGDRSTIDNLVTACVFCNRSKGAKTLAEWRRDL